MGWCGCLRRWATMLAACWLVAPLCASAAETPKTVFCEIDGAQTWPISPYIYGTNMPDWQGKTKHLTLTRWGGNRTTAYNWETNASNAGADWQHQNDSLLDKGDEPANPVRKMITAAHAAGASVIVTVPTIGYVAADKLGGGDVNKTPDYLKTRFFESLPKKEAPFRIPPNTQDRKVYQDEFVQFLETKFPDARKDKAPTIFYCLDNEPDLWSHTHARIHPQKATYAEVVERSVAYATAIKDVAPKALVFGPVNYGWQGYTALQDAPDKGNRDFLDFYLQQMREAEKKAERRLLDVLDLHWYPEARAGNVRVCEDDARAAVAEARVESPRSLWDPQYKEESWITQWSTKGPIKLLPRLKEKIDKHYPGTKLAITEYYYGGGADISGALAQADVLGIFGREGLFAAALWHLGKTDDRYIYAAFAMFRNYNGAGGAFGDTGLMARINDAARASVYASLDGRGRVVIVAINKTADELPLEMNFRSCPAATKAHVYRLTRREAKPETGGDIPLSRSGVLNVSLPGLSVTTLVLVDGGAAQR